MKMKNGKQTGEGRRQRAPFRALLSVFLSLAVLCGAVPAALPQAFAVTQSSIDSLKDKAGGLEEERQQLEEQLSALKDQQSNAEEEKSVLEQQINVLQEELDNLSEQVEQYDALIADKTAQIDETQAQEDAQYQLFCQRVRAMEEDENVTYWSILFSSTSFADMIDRFNIINEIMDYDQQVQEQLLALRQQLADEKSALEDSRQEQQNALEREENLQEQMQDKLDAQNTLLTQLQEQETQTQQDLDITKAAADEMDSQIAKAEAEMEAQIAAQKAAEEAARKASEEAAKNAQNSSSSSGASGSSSSGGSSSSSGGTAEKSTGFLWPLPGNTYITSSFGYRTHPVTGETESYHAGVDIRASYGESILAAKSGTVIISAYSSTYGNYVVISHGDGYTTLYAHMSDRAVSAGQAVSQGQTIGYVGSTGRSTGNHLHFEVRLNGTRVNPLDYFPSMKFTIAD